MLSSTSVCRLGTVLWVVWAAVLGGGVALAAADDRISFWPLDEGQGDVVQDQLSPRTGGLRAGGRTNAAGTPPVWVKDGGKAALSFPGGDVSGHVQLNGGGSILSGPRFHIGVDVWLGDAQQASHILAAKAHSNNDGGFSLDYWGHQKQLHFQFADGQRSYRFAVQLKEGLSTTKWTPIQIIYDGRELVFAVDGKEVDRVYRPGLALAPSKWPLYVGSYHQGNKAFKGRIRNVSLAVPAAQGEAGTVVKRVDKAPVIDGELKDAAWQSVAFSQGFTDLRRGRAADPDTRFAFLLGDEHLYLAVRAAHPNPKILAGQRHPGDSEMFWRSDLVELFIDPEYTFERYFHFAVNAAGFTHQALMLKSEVSKPAAIELEWEVRTAQNEAGWTAEAAIPLASLMVQPGYEGPWLFNIARRHVLPNGGRLTSRFGPVASAKDTPYDATFWWALTGDLKPDYQSDEPVQLVVDRREQLGWKLNFLPEPMALLPISIKGAAKSMTIANNLVVPNWFHIAGTGKQLADDNARFFFDLPEGVQLVGVGSAHKGSLVGGASGWFDVEKVGPVTHDGKPYHRHRVNIVQFHPSSQDVGPFYLSSNLPDGTRISFYYTTEWDGGKTRPRKLDLLVREFPTPGIPQGIHNGILSARAAEMLGWPDIWDNYGQLGFNSVAVHTKWDRVKGGYEMMAPMMDEARRHGYQTAAWDSPFMYKDEEALRINPATGKTQPHTCPTYRGDIYQAEVQRLVDAAVALRLDLFILDIEDVGGAPGRTGQCVRCNEYVAGSRLAPREAMIEAGAEMVRDVRNALAAAWPTDAGELPNIAVYHTLPGGHVYGDLFDFDTMQAEGTVSAAQPVYYDGGPAQEIGEKLRRLREDLQGGFILPWHQPGTVIEYPSSRVYDRVLENYGSGALGIAWFSFKLMEGEDYYYAAKAMMAVRPVERLLAEAKPVKITTDSSTIHVSALRHQDGYILLASNYAEAAKDAAAAVGQVVTVTLPSSVTGQIWDLAHQKVAGRVAGQTVQLRWQPGDPDTHTNLYYVGAREPVWPGR